MSSTLFKKVDYSLGKLIQDIAIGSLGLPDIQRPFVWPNAKVRDLFDSMYKGYPVGYFLFWETGADGIGSKVIGAETKQKAASLLIVDGQQRLTSLYAVVHKVAVLRDNVEHEFIRISFNPLKGEFVVPDAATDKQAEFIPDISEVFLKDTYETISDYLSRLRLARDVSKDEEHLIAKAIGRLAGLTNYPFVALELTQSANEEQVADVFVRINSEGKKLNQSDFILTLMSVFWDQGRTDLEHFSIGTRKPIQGNGASPFNPIFQPEPDQLLRVNVGVAFRRGRLEHVYSILRGKDLRTGEFSSARREAQFAELKEAQGRVLNLTHWADFLNVVRAAGYRHLRYVSSEGALIFAYQLYLIGRTEFGVEPFALKQTVARWLFMSLLTGRYTSSPESRYETDLKLLPDGNDPVAFVKALQGVELATLTDDYWAKTLPLELSTSASRGPSLFAYYAALVLCDAKALFSKGKVADLLDPPAIGNKKPLERHHLFPKRYLHKIGTTQLRDTNQIANYALVEWDDNIAISDIPPKDYWPKYASRFSDVELKEMMHWHGLLEGWQEMSYQEFLVARRPLIAKVIRQGYEKLTGTGGA
ncbi:GmrSD restriction endonuclease domain-containing protein [Azonexus hydrophilus]|uniref:GmrSD restriction endonuclease domain-containing protein n=1 Tax=Azonexus hydrophilus TaxID=418702 RepID=UPI000427A8DA|nr:DUF262 domain-containing protein [Azonexus hydrophilus]